MKKKYEVLFKPYTFNNGVEIKNRLVVAPLTIYDSGKNGELTPTARNFWRDRFRGFGMYIMPFTNVAPSGIGFESPNAFDESSLATLQEYVKIAHEQGAKIVMQLAHSGYKAKKWMTKGHPVVSPTGDSRGHARTMTGTEVKQMVANFANAAELGLRAGMDGVEIQGSNGWLIEQFFAGNINHRNDEWGGSFAGRLKFPLAIIDAIDEVRKKYNRPDFIIGYRFSPERPRQGFTMEDTLSLVDELVKKPLQYLHISLLGFYSHPRRGADKKLTRMQVYHERISGKLPLIGVGSLKTADQILEAYNTGWADLIAVGWAVMLNPNLIDLIKNDHEDQIETSFNWKHAAHYRYTPAMLQAEHDHLDMAIHNPRPVRKN
ncbi:NADH-dependent flavin oxidoreductase [Limosilactobacillus sp. STM2_1]|uniref:NADH-dependent flavin oxidoreductase n=1 Tax=Limosilactobacillus rudii TaxID=2759755 RepID=A0A7W3UMV7_9LACO|nr:NADH-dependent flavin oxidoreductase [Limosilactobacillus rudii]MBB1080458.1 NADH-dependent flavin oxidoreductase [Limosilactobacillus rudii]MBB1098484.1 NADH-dependent flavin oxidoreductase [Limosilactobacillus rudii]MCD7135492.1 NADH-dependent flavin oxidoreductase [Limosilactobacillus rudii]